MAASLYLTSATVEAITVPVDDLISFAADATLPGTTRVLTTRGMFQVMEDVDTILRLLADRAHAVTAKEAYS